MSGAVRAGEPDPSASATAAVRALERAAEVVADALRHLHVAGQVAWSGGAALRYGAELDAVTDGVRRAQLAVGRATTAMAEHAAAACWVGPLTPVDTLGVPPGALVPGPTGWRGAP